MSGHSKWSTIKRQKAATDAKRSKVWARSTRDIMTAAREGGGDAKMNPRLAMAVEKAKSVNMPKDNIERAIKRGTGEIEGADYVEMTYEGYAAGGIAVIVEALTDNTNRTVADVRSIFSKAGGSLGQTGSVSYLFERKAVFTVPSEGIDEMDLFEFVVDAGAEDLASEGEIFVVTAPAESYGSVHHVLEEANVKVDEASLQRVPVTYTRVDVNRARQVAHLIEKLEEHQDVQSVFTTMEIDDDILAALS
jgi:YebC/PmpR family DNA-binding regulatory protein